MSRLPTPNSASGQRKFLTVNTKKCVGQKLMPNRKNTSALGSTQVLSEAVCLPEGGELTDWLALNTVQFVTAIDMLYSSLAEFCTSYTCPIMSAGPKYEYYWADGVACKSPVRVSAPVYIRNLMGWSHKLLDDEAYFPTHPTASFPANFMTVVGLMYKRLFRVYAHIYHHHFDTIIRLGEDVHLNTSFQHFLLFAFEFDLVSRSDMAPMAELVESVINKDSRIQAVLAARAKDKLVVATSSNGPGPPVESSNGVRPVPATPVKRSIVSTSLVLKTTAAVSARSNSRTSARALSRPSSAAIVRSSASSSTLHKAHNNNTTTTTTTTNNNNNTSFIASARGAGQPSTSGVSRIQQPQARVPQLSQPSPAPVAPVLRSSPPRIGGKPSSVVPSPVSSRSASPSSVEILDVPNPPLLTPSMLALPTSTSSSSTASVLRNPAQFFYKAPSSDSDTPSPPGGRSLQPAAVPQPSRPSSAVRVVYNAKTSSVKVTSRPPSSSFNRRQPSGAHPPGGSIRVIPPPPPTQPTQPQQKPLQTRTTSANIRASGTRIQLSTHNNLAASTNGANRNSKPLPTPATSQAVLKKVASGKLRAVPPPAAPVSARPSPRPPAAKQPPTSSAPPAKHAPAKQTSASKPAPLNSPLQLRRFITTAANNRNAQLSKLHSQIIS
eukprot:gnl/Hemi2/2988_TR1054_c0_g1_i1.p1 gnl/Hemi2/2988_TR1054_c0_g1~~gnl/Hemi2/2988_TR1054_c0_g1_i1.p1  ORF type:complete len:664 (+),score=95.08 gnl/Hemi2/2988_TR1054_c0_g1_i1:100-2091(+)